MKKIVLTICFITAIAVIVGCREAYVATPVTPRLLTPEEVEARRVAEKERLKLEAERLAREKVEREEREKREAEERAAWEKEEKERLAREKVEREEREKEAAIRKRIETLQSYSAVVDGEQVEWKKGYSKKNSFCGDYYDIHNSTLEVDKLNGAKIVFVDIFPVMVRSKCSSEMFSKIGELDFKIDRVDVTIDGKTITYLAKDSADAKTISESQEQFEYYLSKLAEIKEGLGFTSLGNVPVPAEHVKQFNEKKKEGEKISSFPAYEGKVGEDNVVWVRNPNEGRNFDSILEVTRSDRKQLRFFAEFSSLDKINLGIPPLKRVEVTEFGETRTYYGGIAADSDFIGLAKEQFKHYLLGLVELKKNDGLRILNGEEVDKATGKN